MRRAVLRPRAPVYARSLRRRATAPLVALLGALPVVATQTACSAARARTASAPDPRVGAPTVRGGFVSFGTGVRLRSDTPALTPLLEPEREAERSLLTSNDAWRAGPYGPRGDEGYVAPIDAGPPPGWVRPYGVGSYPYGAAVPYGPAWFGTGVPAGAFGGPVGALRPGYRVPEEPAARATGTSASAFPGSDVARHRPGLSVGSGPYGRDGR